MSATPDVRSQLQSLRIAKDKRPQSEARAGRRLPIWPILLLVVIGGVLAGGYAGRERLAGLLSSGAKADDVRLIPVTLRREQGPPPVLTATGKIVSDHRVLVFTKVSGQIVELFFEQGDRVTAGQKLARIEDVLYRARRDEAEANLKTAKALAAYEEVNFSRLKKLYDSGRAPEIEFANGRRTFDQARAGVEAAEAALTFTNKVLVDTEVTAPIAGVILERNVNVGDFVAAEGGRGAMANAQLGSIADMAKLRVEVDVSELDIARLRQNMPCVITPDAYKDRTYPGHVMWIDPGANYSKATVQVKVRVENPDESLRVEGSAQVAFLPRAVDEGTSEPSIWIPKSACQIDAGGTSGAVFVLEGNRLKKATIGLGETSAGLVQVTSGLREGQRIVADGLEKVVDGQRYVEPEPS